MSQQGWLMLNDGRLPNVSIDDPNVTLQTLVRFTYLAIMLQICLRSMF